MKIFTNLLVFLTLIFLGSPSQLYAEKIPGATEIVIMHTNDMHAKIDNMGKLAYLVDSLRKSHKYVFLVTAGDIFTGNPVVDMVEDKGYPMIDLMNRCGFTVCTLGNHEFDIGQEKLNARMKQATFPFISCNIDASNAVLNQPKPYYILRAGKIQIPVLGIIQLGENGLPDSHPSKMQGLKFTDGIMKAKEYRWLKKKYGMLIGLTHLGIESDEPLAKAIPEFDLIIGGHSHTVMTKPMMVKNVMIVQTGSGLKNVGITILTVKRRVITKIRYELISLDSIKENISDVQDLINKYNDNDELNREIGYLGASLAGADELGSMMTDAITRELKVDFAFQNRGGIRISSLPEGKIRLKDVYQLDPFGNMVVVYTMNLPEIKSLICNSFNREKQVDLEVSGMTYTILSDRDGTCSDVEMLDLSGNPLKENREYTIGINSYIASSYKFDHRDLGTTSFTTSAQALINYLGGAQKVNYAGVKRIGVRLVE
jgi:5'-nucleotidase / UDP-sugar diphosphatase